jgi:hypothetical protein
MGTTLLFICLLVVVLGAIVTVLLLSRVRIDFTASRVKDNDHITVIVRALFGLFRYRVHIPTIDFRNLADGIMVKHKANSNALPGAAVTDKTHIDREWVMQFYDRMQIIVKNIFNLMEWTKDTLAHVECTYVRWHTRVGIGDAPETAVVTGLLWGVKSSLLSFVMGRICLKAQPDVQVVPQYNQQLFATDLACKAQIRLGYVLKAGVRLAVRMMRGQGNLKTWQQILFRPRLKGTS